MVLGQPITSSLMHLYVHRITLREADPLGLGGALRTSTDCPLRLGGNRSRFSEASLGLAVSDCCVSCSACLLVPLVRESFAAAVYILLSMELS